MNRNLTDITLVLDRSGSMNSILQDAQGGLDHFIADQKNQPGECTFTLIQFNGDYDVPIKAKPIKEVEGHRIEPSGQTALLDAVGRAINETGNRLSQMPEPDRPGLVVFVILTDGLENASQEFASCNGGADRIKAMIEHQQTTYSWQFTYLGANQDAWDVARNLGIKGGIATYSPDCTETAFMGASANVGRMRSASMLGGPVENRYTDSEVQKMTGDSR